MTIARRRVAIALGSNTHDRGALLRGGVTAITHIDGVRLLAASRVEETAPIGPPQPPYLNQMVLVDTPLELEAMMLALQAIEVQHGRVRTVPKGPRTLDLDIVWAELLTITNAALLVPHPGLNDRDFWQRQLVELLGDGAAAEAIAAARLHAGMDTGRLLA